MFALASSPTVRGAIDGKVEASVGGVYTAGPATTKLRVESVLDFTGRHRWWVDADPVVWVQTRVTGTLLVGAFVANPSGGWEAIPGFTFRPLTVFDDAQFGQGGGMVYNVPFKRTGAEAFVDIPVVGGKNYLVLVVAQVALRILTTNSHGQPVQVRNGNFDTWGSLAGVVPEIWIEG